MQATFSKSKRLHVTSIQKKLVLNILESQWDKNKSETIMSLSRHYSANVFINLILLTHATAVNCPSALYLCSRYSHPVYTVCHITDKALRLTNQQVFHLLLHKLKKCVRHSSAQILFCFDIHLGHNSLFHILNTVVK